MLTYLASPYSHPDPAVVEQRMKTYTIVDGILLQRGKFTVSPLAKHFGLTQSELPNDWDYWQHYSRALLSQCDELYVIVDDAGWLTSAGVQGEIAFAKEHNIPVYYINVAGQIVGWTEIIYEDA